MLFGAGAVAKRPDFRYAFGDNKMSSYIKQRLGFGLRGVRTYDLFG